MRPQFQLEVLVPGLSFRRSLRSCDIKFLYHDPVETDLARLRPQPEAPQAILLWSGTPASVPRRPPSHLPGRRVETRPAEPLAARPVDAACACHHKASPNFGSAPIAQSAPTAHTQSIRHR